jgi:hypothetical protein
VFFNDLYLALHWLRRQGSNLGPSPYADSTVTSGADYIIILSDARRFAWYDMSYRATPLRDSLYTFPCGLGSGLSLSRSSPNSPRYSIWISPEGCCFGLFARPGPQGAALPLSYAGIQHILDRLNKNCKLLNFCKLNENRGTVILYGNCKSPY